MAERDIEAKDVRGFSIDFDINDKLLNEIMNPKRILTNKLHGP